MDASALRVVADDLTGACDVAAALLPWPDGVLVEAFAAGGTVPAGGLRVRNTQSRTLAAEAAGAAVRYALVREPLGRDAVVLKKIDTALRGHLGVELEAAMEAVGAAEAFVLPAIPAVGRTTIGGVQRIDGVPVHETTFADDPLHPIRDSSVVAHLEHGTRRRAASLSLADVRSPAGLTAAVERGRAAGRTVFVCDAESDDDLAQAVAAVLARPRPIVLAGSLGLGLALRRRLALAAPPVAPRPRWRAGAGTLVVVGSMHPMARRQADVVAGSEPVHEVDEASQVDALGARAARALAEGRTVVLRTPAAVAPGAERGLLVAVARVARACLERQAPGGLVLVGGETAYAVLEAAHQPWIRVDASPAPLVVEGTLLGGPLDGVPLVTKGGSSGGPDTLRVVVARLLARGDG